MDRKVLKRSPIVFIVISLIFFLIPSQVHSSKNPVVALLPFNVHSSEGIDYIQQGILDMLYSRLTSSGNIDVLPKDLILDSLKVVKSKSFTVSDVYTIGEGLKVDFIVWGTITKIGNSISIDVSVLELKSKKTTSFFGQSQGLDDVIVKVNDIAQKIQEQVRGSILPITVQERTVKESPLGTVQSSTAKTAITGQETAVITSMRKGKRGTLTEAINPDFLTGGQPVGKKGFWMSHRYPTEFRGVDVGDVNGDGKNEIVAVDARSVYIFQLQNGNLVLLKKITDKSFTNLVGVDVVDVNGDGSRAIVVSGIVSIKSQYNITNTADSFIIEWINGKFEITERNLPWIFRSVVPSDGRVRLLGQKIVSIGGARKPFDSPIYEMVRRGGKMTEGVMLKIPLGICVYGLALDGLGSGRDKIIAYDEYDHLSVFEETDKELVKIRTFTGSKELLYSSDEVFGGSNLFIETAGEDNPGEGSTVYNTYLNPRIIPYDVNRDGHREIIVVKNISSIGRIMKNVRVFSASEFYSLEWDNAGLVENWRTRRMNGYVADFQIKDMDNDGEDEIIMALVTPSGTVAGRSSFIAYYKLKAQ
ncbi:MAG: FG-GAP-like repeat-containing protein [Syntrophales bacterium]|nr:FG-GAP-like repeat-containing protein [Syntrophales bacterium]